MSTRIAGASVWEQEMYDYVSNHVATEGAILSEYQRLAEDPSGAPAFRYVAELILADERRHHQIFNDLATSLRDMAELRVEDQPIPPLHGLAADRERIIRATDQLLESERGDAKVLKQLAKKLRDVRETTLWGLLVDLMQADTAKHIRMLEFIRDSAEDPAT